ncbi:MAG: DUF1566 domain-containing protein [Acidobacteria bacterium]|nr:DUF1566 domain-containing protein [Acidobacteriota bacterium]
MKRCPQCKRTYVDESLFYCMEDGVPLQSSQDLQATEILQYPLATPSQVTQPSPYAQAAAQPNSRTRSFNAIHIIILVLAVLLTGSVVALVYKKRNAGTDSKPGQTDSTPAKQAERNVNEQDAKGSADSSVTNTSPAVSANQSRYSSNSCGSIKDTRTGLEWYVGPDRNVTWHEAQQWITTLAECGGGWRMPSIDEVRALYNPSASAGTGFYLNGRYYPAHIDPAFNRIGGGSWVWSGERAGADEARAFNLNQGIAVTYSTMNTYYATRAFAVRQGK